MSPLYPAPKSTVPYALKIAASVLSHVAPQIPGQPIFPPLGAGCHPAPQNATRGATCGNAAERLRRRTVGNSSALRFLQKSRSSRSVFASLHVSAHGFGLGLLRLAEHGLSPSPDATHGVTCGSVADYVLPSALPAADRTVLRSAGAHGTRRARTGRVGRGRC